jgi:hypothetical protein
METILRYFQVRAFRRGTTGHNTAWIVVAAALWMLLRARRSEDVIYRTKLLPGERLVIDASRPGPTSDSGS